MKKLTATTIARELVKRDDARERLVFASTHSREEIFNTLDTQIEGLDPQEREKSRTRFGTNVTTYKKGDSALKRFITAFINPFTIVLGILAIASCFTDIIMASPKDKDYATVIIITIMVTVSGVLRFVSETRSSNAAAHLTGLIHTDATVARPEFGKKDIPMEELLVGDIVYLSAGDLIPADLRIIKSKDLFISQSALTGESEPVEKLSLETDGKGSITELNNLAFMGSTVISGSAMAVVISVGNETLLGGVTKEIGKATGDTNFERGVNAVSFVLIKFMLVMVPIVFFVNGFTKGDWMKAGLFAISVAVGLTPEMLPMIVTTSLAKGAVAMSKKKVIIKNLNAIQNLGSINILCTDKTGTLTQDKVILQYHLNVKGEEDGRVLKHAFLNSFFQTGLKNLIDMAVIDRQNAFGAKELIENYTKVDEIPFDFNRRRMSVVVCDKTGKTQLITKGAIEEMLNCCSYFEYDGKVAPITTAVEKYIINKSKELNEEGMRVVAVAQKTNPAPVGEFSVTDESEMVLIGFLAFLDPPKDTTKDAIKALHDHGVDVKILTGDNERVTKCICKQVGLKADKALLGSEIDDLSDKELLHRVREAVIFAKLSPTQKAKVVSLLKEDGNCVGYMGDGINDAPAMKASDVGISVDSAVDIAKESAAVVLLEKDLMVLESGVIEGRKTYGNMIKYIKMTASSNLGNMFSVLIASALLPFLPMAALQLITLNLIYDTSCTAIPWDNVDKDFLKVPRNWDASSVKQFMLWFGPTSSIFDIMTFVILYFIICPLSFGGMFYSAKGAVDYHTMYISLFQSGWFIESMWTQTLVIHMLRTAKASFIQSMASKQVTILTFVGIALVTALPYSPLARFFGLTPLPPVFFGYLVVIVLAYMILVTIVKKLYIKKYGELL